MTTKPKKVKIRPYLKISNEGGGTYVSLEEILASPKLQRQCLEKAALRKSVQRLREAGLLDERPMLQLVK
jgi:hypothetical protein